MQNEVEESKVQVAAATLLSYLYLGLGIFLHIFFALLPMLRTSSLLTSTRTIVRREAPTTAQHIAAFNLPTRERALIIVAVAHLLTSLCFVSKQEHVMRFLKKLTSVWSSELTISNNFCRRITIASLAHSK